MVLLPDLRLLGAVGVGRDPVRDLEVHEHAGHGETPAEVGVVDDVAALVREDQAPGPRLGDAGRGADEPLPRRRGGRQPRRRAQHHRAGDVGG